MVLFADGHDGKSTGGNHNADDPKITMSTTPEDTGGALHNHLA